MTLRDIRKSPTLASRQRANTRRPASNKLIAHSVIARHPNLTKSDKAIASDIVDHYNLHTGRCDPSIERLARRANCTLRTVNRAIRKLQQLGLITHFRHGGRKNCNSFQPDWLAFKRLNDEWQQKQSPVSRCENATIDGSSTRHSATQTSDTNVAQTLSGTLNRTCRLESEREARDTVLEAEGNSRGLSGTTIRSGKAHSPSVSSVFTQPGKSARDAAYDAAEARWNKDVQERYKTDTVNYAKVIEAITKDLQHAATLAEQDKRGAGIRLIIVAMNSQGIAR